MSATRREATTTEMGEPSLIFARRAHAAAPAELLIVKDGDTQVWTISPERTLRLAQQFLDLYATHRPHPIQNP